MKTFTQQVARAIETSGQTRYQIAKATGIEQSVLSKLVHGKGWIGKEGMDALAAELGLVVTVKNPKTAAKQPRKAKTAGGNAAPLRR